MLVQLTLFGFISFVLILDINFLAKNFVLINLIVTFWEKTCFNFSNKNLYWNLLIIGIYGLWSLRNFLDFQKGQPQTNILPRNSNPFYIKLTVVQVKISKITSIFLVWNLLTTGSQTKKNLFCHKKILWNFKSHYHWLILQTHNVLSNL